MTLPGGMEDGSGIRLSVQLLHLLVISVKIKATFCLGASSRFKFATKVTSFRKTSFKVKGVLVVSQISLSLNSRVKGRETDGGTTDPGRN